MSDPQILVCGSLSGANGPRHSLELLRKVALPNAWKFVVVTGKFETEEAKKFNVEADYPPEPAQLQTIAAWAESSPSSDARMRDGYDLFCLLSILRKHGPFSHAVLLRNACGLEQGWEDLAQKLGDEPFLVFGQVESEQGTDRAECNVLLRLTGDKSGSFVERAWELYTSGTVYAFDDYSFRIALGAAAESLRFQQQTAGSGDG